MGFILQSDYVFNDFTSQGLDKVPVNARVRVGLYTYVLVKEGASASTTIQQGIDGGYLKQELNNCQSTYSCANSNNYQIFPSGWQGKVKITTYDSNNSITGYFEVVNYNADETNFEIITAHFSNNVRQQNSLSSNSLILFLGWSFYADGNYFGICVENNTNINKIMIDTGECGVPCQWLTKTFANTNYIYAPRRGGGTYIQELGIKFDCLRTMTSTYDGQSYDYYKFINGFIEWNANMFVDQSRYPQYNQTFHRLNLSPQGYFTRCLGGNAESSVGGVQGDAIRNIKGGWDGENYNNGSVTYAWRYVGDGSTWKQDYWGAFKKGRYSRASDLYPNSVGMESYGWQFDASEVVPTANENRPINFSVRWMVRIF